MSFALFLLLNAILLIRPEDFFPEIGDFRLYLIVICLNLAAALPKIQSLLQPNKLVNRPITVCVLGILAATALSNLARLRIGFAFDVSTDFAKVVIYYLLFVAVVDTPERLRIFLGFIVPLVVIIGGLGVLQVNEIIDLEALRPLVQEAFDPEKGERIVSTRMCGAGVFNDPNDVCLVLTLGIVCSYYHAATARSYALAALWWLPIGLFVYGIKLTQSRGGLLGLLSAVGAYCIARFGWRRALPFVVVGLPAAVLAIGGRQSDISAGDTAHERVMLWAAGLSELTRSPLYIMTGIGAGLYGPVISGEAHNSFICGYVEWGLLGGGLFLAMFVLAVRMLYSLRPAAKPKIPRDLVAFEPFLLAMIVGCVLGIYSLSRNYHVLTYLSLGLVESYILMAMPNPPAQFRITRVWLKQTVLIGVGGLIFLKFFTQFAGQLGN